MWCLHLKTISLVLPALFLLSQESDPQTPSTAAELKLTLSSIKFYPEDETAHSRSLPNPRRQYSSKSQLLHPPSDAEIARLLKHYQGIVHKYGKESQKNPQPDIPERNLNNTEIQTAEKEGNTPKVAREDEGKEAQDEDQLAITRPPLVDWGAMGFGQTTMKTEEFPGHGNVGQPPQGKVTPNEAMGAASRFTTRTTTIRRRRRTAPYRHTFVENCDYSAYYCLKAFDTGSVCARTLFFEHLTFKNYCMVDYVNCMERYDVWQLAHMGECFEPKVLTEYIHYAYKDDYFLDNYYLVEDM